MNANVTKGIVLARVNFQEADRILTIITPDNGKIRVMAKGVRKERSKLAGGVELFSINEISFIRGRGEVCTLVSSRLVKNYPNIIKDIDRTMYGYEFLKLLNKVTEDDTGSEYYALANSTLESLNDSEINIELIKLWADIQLLTITGHKPNLISDTDGNKLREDGAYEYDISAMSFINNPNGNLNVGHIKLLRLCTVYLPEKLKNINGINQLVPQCQMLASAMRKNIMHA